jgi:hypothetical protein
VSDLRQEITEAIARKRYAAEPAKLRHSLREEVEREADRIMCVVEPVVAELKAKTLALEEVGKHADALRAERDRAQHLLVEFLGIDESPRESFSMEIKAAGEVERYVFTVQRAGRITPHHARLRAEAERDELRESRFRGAEEAAHVEAAAKALLDEAWSTTDPTLGWSAWPVEYGALAESSGWRAPSELQVPPSLGETAFRGVAYGTHLGEEGAPPDAALGVSPTSKTSPKDAAPLADLTDAEWQGYHADVTSCRGACTEASDG